MWIILGSAVACGLALWHLRVTVPNLVEPTVEEVGDAVLAIKPHTPPSPLRRIPSSSP
ncbi:hypothetical protein JCM18920_270 [Cutibacterium acnes JCM 18920]|nr:hypothetical protein JCM18920_270 [Cutibacterium acnes JCM 18920]